MGFLRREPLHRRLAREGGLDPPPLDTLPQWGEVGIHGVQRPREWDTVVAVDADLEGNEIAFVALPGGSLVVQPGPDGVHDPDDLAPLAQAVERAVDPPYRAEAVRRGERRWAVAARRIRVVELPDTAGETIELVVTPDERRLEVDGARPFGSEPLLEELLDEGDGVVRARRIDGPLWEVDVVRL